MDLQNTNPINPAGVQGAGEAPCPPEANSDQNGSASTVSLDITVLIDTLKRVNKQKSIGEGQCVTFGQLVKFLEIIKNKI